MNAVAYEEARSLFDYDPATGALVWRAGRYAGHTAGAINGQGYRQIRVNGRLHYAHRLAWLLKTKSWPTQHIDHINGLKSDNRIENLREATRSQNMGNARARSGSVKGCHFHRATGKWRAQIMAGGRRRSLGLFSTKEQAHTAYTAAAIEFFGPFARAA